MKRSVARLLGIYYVEIIWYHDSGEFDRLERAANTLYQLLGFDKHSSNKAGKLLKECYKVADLAEQQKSLYEEVFQKFLKIAHTLNYSESVARHQINWWVQFRKKNWLRASYYLFRQQLATLGIYYALLATYYLLMVGIYHNKRDREKAIEYATKYWDIAFPKIQNKQYPLIG